jgi:hypothetical protein
MYQLYYFINNSAGNADDFSNVLSANSVRYSNAKWEVSFFADVRKRQVDKASASTASCATTHVARILFGDLSVCGFMM